jgi:signal peptidase I
MEIIPPKNQSTPPQSYQRPPSYAGQPPPPAPIGTPPESSNRFEWLRGAVSTIGLFVTAFLIAILLNTFVLQSYQVDGQSMEPTLQNDDRLIVNKVPRTISRIDGHQYVPHRGDIIIFNMDSVPGFVGQKQLIKRVIGLPGEHVVVKNGRVNIYNPAHPEGFDPDDSGGYKTSSPISFGDVDTVLAANQLFVCGDNRPNSEDSRSFGPITTNQVVAKLVLRILPLGQAKSF